MGKKSNATHSILVPALVAAIVSGGVVAGSTYWPENIESMGQELQGSVNYGLSVFAATQQLKTLEKQYAAKQKKLAQVEKVVAELPGKIAQMQQNLAAAETATNQERWQTMINNALKNSEKSQASIATIKASIAAFEAKIAAKTAEVEALKAAE